MFSRDEIRQLLAVMGMCTEASTDRQLSEILAGPVRALLPHTCAAWGVCRQSTDTVLRVRNIDFPASFVTSVAQEGEVLASPVAYRWKQNRRVTHFRPAQLQDTAWAHRGAFERWHSLFRATGLDTITAHGLTDEAQDITSYFAFGNTSQLLPERDSVLVSILTPHLHGAVAELLRRGPARAGTVQDGSAALSAREREVLSWVQAGKTNYEIGLILGISEFTVKNHMKRICGKLDAGNRTHAIAKAMHLGFLTSASTLGLPAALA